MDKAYLCANCGALLDVKYRALPKLVKVIRLVSYHECGELVDLNDLDLIPSGQEVPMDKTEFVQKINELHPPVERTVFDEEIGDRRSKENIKEPISTAPGSVQDMLNSMVPEEVED